MSNKGSSVMKKLTFEVEFLSDIVLPATSNTEGNVVQLDFIPGSNFLGMVASKYGKFENSFDIFHSGKVRFGDATILKDAKQTYKIPFSYFHKKLDDKTLYNHHLIDNYKDLGQLKQLRNGYITEDHELIYIGYNYSQKSAYDKNKRRSRDSQMYGYNAIQSGTKWQFVISYDDTSILDEDLKLLTSIVIGKKRLGKSKSAEYGLVEIKKIENAQKLKNVKSDEIILYANSRLSLVDEAGNPTYDLKYLCDNLEDKNIVYEKTQLRVSSFTPYNGIRATKDYERICIHKGSVIVLKDISDEQMEQILNGVGAYLSEGFGEILLNPIFLMQNGFKLKEETKRDSVAKEMVIKSDLAQFLRNKEDKKQAKLSILNDVDNFIQDNKPLYEKIKPSQWGKIRSICTSSSDDFKNKIREYVENGVKKWEKKQIDTLLNNDNSLEFIKLISIQMPKQRGSKND